MCIIFIFTNLGLAKFIFKNFAYFRSLTQLESKHSVHAIYSMFIGYPNIQLYTQYQRYISYPSALAVQNTAIITSVHIPQTFSKQKWRGLKATLGVSSWDDTMVCTSGCRYSSGIVLLMMGVWSIRGVWSGPGSGIELTACGCICWLFHRIYYDARNHKHKTIQ